MLSRWNAIKAVAVLPLASLLPSVPDGSFAERAIPLIRSATHEELTALLHFSLDLLSIRLDSGTPRTMTTGEALEAQLVNLEALPSMAKGFYDRQLVEALLRTST